MKIQTVERPYTLTFHDSGNRYPLTSADAQRLIDEYPAHTATRNRVVLRPCARSRTGSATIRPATLGGGIAFKVTR